MRDPKRILSPLGGWREEPVDRVTSEGTGPGSRDGLCGGAAHIGGPGAVTAIAAD